MVDCGRLARLHAVRDGRVGHRRRHGRLAEGPDDAARPGLRRRQRAGARRAPEGRPAHALLGLDVPRGRSALPEVLRHAAGAPALRPAQGARHAARRGAGARGRAATRLLAEATRQAVARWAEGQALAFNATEPAERANSVTCVLMPDRESAAAARLLPRQVRRGPRHGHRRALRARRSASRTWATSTRRWCSARSAPSRWRWPRSASRTAAGGVQAAVEYLGREVTA